MRALLARASRAVDENAPDADTLCNMAKVFASEEILKVAQHALELHGGNGVMLDFGVEKLFRDAAIFLHMDATVDISRLKIVKSMFPHTAGKYAGPEKLAGLRQPETGDHDREPNELREARSLAKGQKADQKRKRRHERWIHRRPPAPSSTTARVKR